MKTHVWRRCGLVRRWSTIPVLVAVTIVACSSSFKIKNISRDNARSEAWTLYGGTRQRANFRAKALQPPLKNIWVYKASSAVGKSILAVNGVLFATTLDGRLEAVDIAKGTKIKRGKTPEHFAATCAYREPYLIIASSYGEKTLALYDVRKGETLWNIAAGDIESEPLVTSDAVYVAALYNHIDKYDLNSGEKSWGYKTADLLHSSPALSQNILVNGCDNGSIYALNARNGKLIWEQKAQASILATPVIWEDKVFVGSLDTTFYAFNLSNGDSLWTFRAQHPLYQTAATDGDVVMFGASDGQFYCLDAATGSMRWKYQAQSVVSTSPLLTQNIVYFGTLDKHYYGLDVHNGEVVWDFETKGRVRTAPIVWKSYLLGASEDKFLYAFRPAPD